MSLTLKRNVVKSGAGFARVVRWTGGHVAAAVSLSESDRQGLAAGLRMGNPFCSGNGLNARVVQNGEGLVLAAGRVRLDCATRKGFAVGCVGGSDGAAAPRSFSSLSGCEFMAVTDPADRAHGVQAVGKDGVARLVPATGVPGAAPRVYHASNVQTSVRRVRGRIVVSVCEHGTVFERTDLRARAMVRLMGVGSVDGGAGRAPVSAARVVNPDAGVTVRRRPAVIGTVRVSAAEAAAEMRTRVFLAAHGLDKNGCVPRADRKRA